jgi:hypothetical protein
MTAMLPVPQHPLQGCATTGANAYNALCYGWRKEQDI